MNESEGGRVTKIYENIKKGGVVLDTYEAVYSRRSVRDFEDKEIDNEES